MFKSMAGYKHEYAIRKIREAHAIEILEIRTFWNDMVKSEVESSHKACKNAIDISRSVTDKEESVLKNIINELEEQIAALKLDVMHARSVNAQLRFSDGYIDKEFSELELSTIGQHHVDYQELWAACKKLENDLNLKSSELDDSKDRYNKLADLYFRGGK